VERKSGHQIKGGKIFRSQNMQDFEKVEGISCPVSREQFKKMALKLRQIHTKGGKKIRAEEERFSCEGKRLYRKLR
jgi:hypothetical protein